MARPFPSHATSPARARPGPASAKGLLRRRFAVLEAAATALVLLGCQALGGLQNDGDYLLPPSEQALDCGGLAKRVRAHLEALQLLPARAKQEGLSAPSTALAAVGRLIGGWEQGFPAFGDYARERGHVLALVRRSNEQGCPALDVASELASIDAAMAAVRSP
jgi:hypothetical protein